MEIRGQAAKERTMETCLANDVEESSVASGVKRFGHDDGNKGGATQQVYSGKSIGYGKQELLGSHAGGLQQ